ncbi:MAG: hypothetical protein AAF590_06475 [Pseudomonadota bacterium]
MSSLLLVDVHGLETSAKGPVSPVSIRETLSKTPGEKDRSLTVLQAYCSSRVGGHRRAAYREAGFEVIDTSNSDDTLIRLAIDAALLVSSETEYREMIVLGGPADVTSLARLARGHLMSVTIAKNETAPASLVALTDRHIDVSLFEMDAKDKTEAPSATVIPSSASPSAVPSAPSAASPAAPDTKDDEGDAWPAGKDVSRPEPVLMAKSAADKAEPSTTSPRLSERSASLKASLETKETPRFRPSLATPTSSVTTRSSSSTDADRPALSLRSRITSAGSGTGAGTATASERLSKQPEDAASVSVSPVAKPASKTFPSATADADVVAPAINKEASYRTTTSEPASSTSKTGNSDNSADDPGKLEDALTSALSDPFDDDLGAELEDALAADLADLDESKAPQPKPASVDATADDDIDALFADLTAPSAATPQAPAPVTKAAEPPVSEGGGDEVEELLARLISEEPGSGDKKAVIDVVPER